MEINKHIAKLQPSATLVINEKVKALRNQGTTVSHFGFGQSPFPIHTSIVKALQENAHNNHYLPVAGLDELRVQLANFLTHNQGINTNKKSVFIGPGSKELLYQSILIFDGEFLIPKGSWVSYLPQIVSKGAKYHILDTSFGNNFKVTSNDIEQFFRENKPEKSSILILNSPNNPTGAIYTDEEFKALSISCRKYDITIFSDEIYSQINFIDSYAPSISAHYPEKTLVFGGLSKVFSAGGYRLGFLVLPSTYSHLDTVYNSLFSETFSCVSSPVQFAALTAYKYDDSIRSYVKNNTLILKYISTYVYQEFCKLGLECTKPQGAFYMMIGFNRYKEKIKQLGITTSKELANFLLEKYHFAMLPGSDFGFNNDDLFFRIAFVDFDGAKVLQAFKNKKMIDNAFIEKYATNIVNGIKNVQEFVGKL